ncbi:MAG: hypothetical protein HOP19_04870 [Acidobacteria bacterium]|nr:hypothetical protein [Acidobacteriota bacterium]
MGGQACVLYGGAEFSRDIDFAIFANSANLIQLRAALEDLQARVIAVPPFEMKYLRRGHAVHFRCLVPEAAGLRVDVMTKMRGVDSFSKLWRRRVTLQSEDGTLYQLMSLPDLMKAKKTQRDKDWPMIRRLIEVHYFNHYEKATASQTRFWFLELRTPKLLLELAASHPKVCRELVPARPLLRFTLKGDETVLAEALLQEEKAEREADRLYWQPLKAEIERLRHDRLRK